MKGVNYLRWRIATANARRGRASFSAQIRTGQVASLQHASPLEYPLDVCSFSSERDLEEQALSILTFVNWAGVPASWTVYSDGSHKPDSIIALQSIGDWLKVVNWDVATARLPKDCRFLLDYASGHAMGKRLIAYSTHSFTTPTLFTDSDVLFYKHAREALSFACSDARHWFLPDGAWGSFDSRFLRFARHDMFAVNGGFILLKPSFSWLPVMDFLQSLKGSYEYFSDQTALHVGLVAQDAFPLDPRLFVLRWSDQFKISSDYCAEEMAIRHYVQLVRHKMWQGGWKRHLPLGYAPIDSVIKSKAKADACKSYDLPA